MRILYTLCGEGNGHATRSKVSIEHLRARGHDVLCAAASSPASKVVAGAVPADRLMTIVGLGTRCRDGEVSIRDTLEENLRRLRTAMTVNHRAWQEAERFAPHAAITDFDSFGWFFARAHGLPLVSIDNHQVACRFLHDPSLVGDPSGMRLLEHVSRAVVPDADHFIVTSFFYVPPRPDSARSTTLVPPILRREVVDRFSNAGPTGDSPPDDSGPVLIYRSSYNDSRTIAAVLAQVPDVPFIGYGFETGADALTPNLVLRPFDERAFIEDLARARAVVGNGGMSLLGESLAFGKPVYAVPVGGQYEQILNAAYVEACGYGRASRTLDADVLRTFLDAAPSTRVRIRSTPQHDANQRLFAALDRLFC